MKRTDLFGIIFLILAALVIYYPVFHACYLYTDESVQLWYGGKGLNFNTSVPQGRYITYRIFTWLFSHIHTIQGLILARLFSLAGWIACLPIWYLTLDRVLARNGLPRLLAFLSCIYLVCMPPFAISVGWASCMELFIACTAALISGYALYTSITANKMGRAFIVGTIAITILCGLLSLFTYQNGFGCFFIPFFIHFLRSKKIGRTISIGIGASLLIYIVYYLLFRISIAAYGLGPSDRSAFCADPLGKILFFLSGPMAAAFHFTRLFNERSWLGMFIYPLIAAAWLSADLFRQRAAAFREKIFFLSGLFVFFLLIDLPSLIVKENYAANRTLLALDLSVFLLLGECLFAFIKKERTRLLGTAAIAALFLANGWYNFNKEFLDPLTAEYQVIRQAVALNIDPATTRVYFIRLPEDGFEKRYGIIRSWDEFGVPSSAKPWTPEPLIRQLILERTGDRVRAEGIIIKSWPDKKAFATSGDTISKGTVLIDAASLLPE
jgi:hypothetical protein